MSRDDVSDGATTPTEGMSGESVQVPEGEWKGPLRGHTLANEGWPHDVREAATGGREAVYSYPYGRTWADDDPFGPKQTHPLHFEMPGCHRHWRRHRWWCRACDRITASEFKETVHALWTLQGAANRIVR